MRARSLAGWADRTQWPLRSSRSSGIMLGARVAARVGAARPEPARGRRVDQVRRTARDRCQASLADPLALELRQRTEQRLGVGMLRVVEEVERRGLLDHLARVHDEDVVGCLGDDAHVVGDDDHRHLVRLPEVVEQVEHGGLHGHVERRRRLVGDQQLRVAGERDRDHHALPHAAREAVRVVLEPLRGTWDPHLLHQLDRLLVRLLLRHVVVAPDRLGDLRPDRQRRIERRHRVLEDHRDLAAADVLELTLGELGQVAALEEHLAGDDLRRGLRDQAHDRERRHRLAAAGLADDPERLPLLDLEADSVDRADRALAREEVRAQVVDLEQCHDYVSFVLGSRASRRPSATKFAHMTSVAIATDGITIAIGCVR